VNISNASQAKCSWFNFVISMAGLEHGPRADFLRFLNFYMCSFVLRRVLRLPLQR
jgi:hypothetical protein